FETPEVRLADQGGQGPAALEVPAFQRAVQEDVVVHLPGIEVEDDGGALGVADERAIEGALADLGADLALGNEAAQVPVPGHVVANDLEQQRSLDHGPALLVEALVVEQVPGRQVAAFLTSRPEHQRQQPERQTACPHLPCLPSNPLDRPLPVCHRSPSMAPLSPSPAWRLPPPRPCRVPTASFLPGGWPPCPPRRPSHHETSCARWVRG